MFVLCRYQLLEIVKREGLSLIAVLTTHHHWDHARGNEALRKSFKSIKKCVSTPCHTAGELCFYVWEDECSDAPAVFTGDTLFIGGCGRFFEGTAEQMHHSLTQVLGSLPPETVFCGHEYTIRNLKFAVLVEPENKKAKEMLKANRSRNSAAARRSSVQIRRAPVEARLGSAVVFLLNTWCPPFPLCLFSAFFL
uniref:Hydroxyacylglutathione hydrolase like n=1 Tax=Nothobranchius furzeri TaxID=105023 RepID=A0A8C6P4Y2_NOTFU